MFKYVFLPVEIRGRAMSLILDVGASAGVVLSSWAVDNWGGAIPNALDSLVLGTNVERNVPVLATRFSKEVPPGMPPLAGLLGTDVLSHYDLLFDGPARRVRLYLPPPNASPDSAAHRPTWFPPGLTSAECTPMIQVSDPPIPRRVEFSMLANGKPVTGFFDSGAKRNNMGLSTAEALGIDTTSPNVRLLPGGIPGAFPLARVSQRVWEVHDVTLVLGKYHFTNSPVSLRLEYPTGTDSPFIGVGLDAISDRLLFVSYSTGQVCLGEPH